MSDIMNFIRDEEEYARDPDGHLLELDEWSRDIAETIAARENVSMSQEHWEVVDLLRDHYRIHGKTPTARVLMEVLAAAFNERGGRRYLYTLFPGGPVHQACTIAGIPAPADSINPSFGSVQ